MTGVAAGSGISQSTFQSSHLRALKGLRPNVQSVESQSDTVDHEKQQIRTLQRHQPEQVILEKSEANITQTHRTITQRSPRTATKRTDTERENP